MDEAEVPMTAAARKGDGAIHSKSLADWIIGKRRLEQSILSCQSFLTIILEK
jgi:hypothetical protein